MSFVQHSILHRSDAARMTWGIGRTDNVQITVVGLRISFFAVVALAQR
jgi:hypothetical protein